jgi:hypothetical protein
MSNQQTFPQSVYPIDGDVASKPGDSNVTVTGIQKTPVAAQIPTDGEILIYNQAANEYIPGDPIVSGPDPTGGPPSSANPVQVAGIDEGNFVRELRTDTYGSLRMLNVEDKLDVLIGEIRAMKTAILALDNTTNPADFEGSSYLVSSQTVLP